MLPLFFDTTSQYAVNCEVLYPSEKPFEIGKADILTEGKDVTIIANGHLVWEALEAYNSLTKIGINAEVINFATIKPLDISTLLKSVEKTGRVVTAEEHQKNGGLGDSVAQALALHKPCPMEMVGVNDSFGESGKPDQLMKKYGLDSSAIVDAVKSVLKR